MATMMMLLSKTSLLRSRTNNIVAINMKASSLSFRSFSAATTTTSTTSSTTSADTAADAASTLQASQAAQQVAKHPNIPFEANAANFPKPQFWIPRADRNGRSIFMADNTGWFGQNRLKRNNRRCPSRDLNFTPVDWNNHKSPFRRLRHVMNLLMFNSSTIQRLAFPELSSVAAVSVALAYYNEIWVSGAADMMLSISTSAFGGATTAIGILAAFRLNNSYARFEECRIFWGETNNTIRDLARQTNMWLQDGDQKVRLLKLLKVYPVVLNFHLSRKGGHHNLLTDDDPDNETPVGTGPSFADRLHAEFLAEMRDIYQDGRDETDYQRMAVVKYNGGNTVIECLTLMGETIAGAVGTVDAIYVRELDEQCQRLCGSFGASERVLRTSLPTSFTRHTSRLMWCWSNALPFALYPAMGPMGTMPAAVFTSWAIQSIEDIGVQLEEPFNVLPMRQYSDGMYDVVGQIERHYNPYPWQKLQAAKIAPQALPASEGYDVEKEEEEINFASDSFLLYEKETYDTSSIRSS